MRARAWWTYTILSVGLIACSSSKSDNPEDGGTAGASSNETGGKSSAAGGGKSGTAQAGKTGSMTGSVTGSGQSGKGGSPDEDDAGPGTTAGKGGSGGAGSTATNLPDDGDQLSLCTMAQGDCNKGLACYAPANSLSPGRGFCSKICEMDSDCGDVSPSSAKYTCTTGGGTRTCEVVCNGTDDTTSCPNSLACVQTVAAVSGGAGGRGGQGRGGPGRGAAGGGGGGSGDGGSDGGRPAQFRCRYPFETSAIWGPCNDGAHVCDKDLSCSSASFGAAGYCSASCEMDGDCKDKPSSGTIAPTCATIAQGGRGMMMPTKRCVLDCSAAKDGCPTGTRCVEGPRTGMGMNATPASSRCE